MDKLPGAKTSCEGIEANRDHGGTKALVTFADSETWRSQVPDSASTLSPRERAP